MKPSILFALAIFVTFSGCRAKVYWLPGELETQGVAARCSELPALSQTLKLKAKIDILVNQSINTEDPVELNALATQVSVKVHELEAVLTPEYTEKLYPVIYRFSVLKSYLLNGETLNFQNFSIFGERVLGQGIRSEEHESTSDVILERPASLLEICALPGTVQGLYSINTPDGNPQFYYRLFIKTIN